MKVITDMLKINERNISAINWSVLFKQLISYCSKFIRPMVEMRTIQLRNLIQIFSKLTDLTDLEKNG